MGDCGRSAWPWPRIAAWGITAAVVSIVVGPTYLRAFLPPAHAYTDFLQEWLSARNYFSGAPIYREIPDSIREQMPERRRADGSAPVIAFTDPATGAVIAEMKYNAHPPGAVLLALPFAQLDYPHAHLLWNVVTFSFFLGGIAVVIRELAIPFGWPSLFPALILLLGNAVLNQLYQGQLNCLLAGLIVSAWLADRHGKPGLAGCAIGLAGAAKLYPLFLLLYFGASRRWSGLIAGIVTFVASNGVAVALFGKGAFHDYFEVVMPAIAGQFQSSWINLSANGFWHRLVGTEPLRDWLGSATAIRAGWVAAGICAVAITTLVAAAGWHAVSRLDRDRAWALSIVGMLLVSPITWSHYFLLLLLPLGLAWSRAQSPLLTGFFGVVLAVLWLPTNFAAQIWFGREGAARFNDALHPHLTTAEDLLLVSIPSYALLSLFVLVSSPRDNHEGDSSPSVEPRSRHL